MTRITIADDEAAALVNLAAGRLAELFDASMAVRGAAMVSLTGGTVARPLYERLADAAWRGRIDWRRMHLFWGDERHVPPDHPDSNFGMAQQALIQHVPVPPSQVHPMRGELADPAEAARAYELELRQAFARAGRPTQTFDVMILGLGEDAHIASIFPASPLLPSHRGGVRGGGPGLDGDASEARVAAVWADHLKAWRITLTPPALLDSHAIFVIVSGARKADAVRAALEEPDDVRRWPAHVLRRAGERVEWYIDRLAAMRLGDR